MPPLPEAIILVLAPLAPLFSERVWLHAQVLRLGAITPSVGPSHSLVSLPHPGR
ncbi:MAG TPA: hypothetical protein VNP04_01405 [Alphaproteobacteria bacterium]|nr:hypothetical protein [Alphaproteobacteria bacterium]